MSRSSLAAWLSLLGAAALALASCPRERTQGRGCTVDSDCGAPASAFACDAQTGACTCRNDDACPPDELCNSAGFCQKRTGCEKNEDCLDPLLFCETSVGTCLPRGRCSSDLHCPSGQVCDFSRSTCVEGCRSSGDCPGSSCRCGEAACACSGTTPEELAACQIGVCDPSFCARDAFCRFGELCGPLPDAGPLARCYSDYHPERRPYCDQCTYGGGTTLCGAGPNYCLIDTRNRGSYCGADCSAGQACPRGFSCQDVIVVSGLRQCSRQNPSCPPNPSLPCTEDSQCRRGGTCVKEVGAASGFCAGRCEIDEGDQIGFCGCQVDSDCSTETCSGGECTITKRKCTGDDDCKTIRCVDFQRSGGCFIGQNCAPANGLSCAEIR